MKKILFLLTFFIIILISINIILEKNTYNLYNDIAILQEFRFESAILTKRDKSGSLKTVNDLYDIIAINNLLNEIISLNLYKTNDKLSDDYEYCLFLNNAKEKNKSIDIMMFFYLDNSIKISVRLNGNTKIYFFKTNVDLNSISIYNYFK